MAIRQRNLEALHSVTMLAPTTVSAANDTTAIDCSAFDGDVCLILTAPASASATAMKVKVQAGEASDGSDAADVTGGAFPDLAAAAYHTRLVLSRTSCLPACGCGSSTKPALIALLLAALRWVSRSPVPNHDPGNPR